MLGKKIENLINRDISYYFIANIIFSVSTFVVNICLPKIFEPSFFEKFIYIFQMVLFLTTLSQFGIVVGLYNFIEENRSKILNTYYSIILFINLILLILGLINGNIVSTLLKLGDLSSSQHLLFYFSIIVSGIFLFNKGRNVADKSYRYMLRVAITAFCIRLLVIIFLSIYQTSSLTLVLFLLFILPFVQDIKDYIGYSIKHIRFARFNENMIADFLQYSSKVWFIGVLFMVSDKLFLISTKGIDVQLTTAIAFSSGFLGIVSLFNSSFSNYFLSNLSSNRIDEIQVYVRRLKKLFIPYIGILLIICLCMSAFVYYSYPSLGRIASIVLFIALLRSGLISYLGMISLLSKVLNLLNIEIVLNIVRIIIVYLLCTYWHPQNLLIWYSIVMFVVPFPELVLVFIINRKVNYQCRQ